MEVSSNKSITTERVDDIPLILGQLSAMQIQSLMDRHFLTHGNWGGVSIGWTLVIWLTYILSQSDHRMVYVEDWVRAHQQTLAVCSGQAIRPLDFCDDRLSRLLTYLSQDDVWVGFHPDFVTGLVRAYQLDNDKKVVRHDGTTLSSQGKIIAGGLLQLGFSKDGKPDLGQIKAMLSALDPLGLPVAVSAVSGEKADDPLYLPAIEQTRRALGGRLLHVGDCKMAAIETRAGIVALGDGYLCPLPKTMQEEMAVYLQPIQTGEIKMTPIERKNAKGEKEIIAEGYESRVTQTHVRNAGTPDEKTICWEETQWVIRSFAYAQSQQKALQKRLDAASAEFADLLTRRQGKKRPHTREEAEHMAADILRDHRVTGLVTVTCQETIIERVVRGYAGKSARTVQDHHLTIASAVNQEAFDKVCQEAGCRVYVAANAGLNMTEAVLLYRGQDIIENNFARLKGQPLSLNPTFLQRDDHRIGLVRLMTIGLSVLCLVEFALRKELQKTQTALPLLPNRVKTQRPATERILKAFRYIDLTITSTDKHVEYYLTPLTPLQKQILAWLGFPLTIYERLRCGDQAQFKKILEN